MKKAKIMLTAITVLAIVGGALAFKAKKFDTNYCTTAVVAGHAPGKCILPLANAQFNSAVSRVYYTITIDQTKCSSANLNCAAVSTSLAAE